VESKRNAKKPFAESDLVDKNAPAGLYFMDAHLRFVRINQTLATIRTLYEITSSPNLSFDQKIRALLELGCQRLGLPYGTLTKQTDDYLELEFLHAPENTWIEHTLVPICNSFCGLTLEREDPLVFEHAGQSVWGTYPAYKTLGLEAYIGTKVMMGRTVYGSLCFLDRAPYSGKFTAADQDFLQLMARWIGSELERRQTERTVQENEHRFRMVCEAIPQQIWTAQPDGNLDYVNQRTIEYFGRHPEQMRDQKWQEVIHPEDLPVSLEHWAQARETGSPYETEFRLLRGSDNQYRWHIGRVLPLHDDSGNIIRWFGTNTDISDQKRSELQKAERESLLTLMLNTGPGCIKRVAADGTLLSMNPVGLTLIDASSEEEVKGLLVFDLVIPEHRPAFEQMHQKVLQGNTETLQFEVKGLKETQRWMETYAVPFKNPLTGQVEQLAVTHDITERKKMESQLRQAQKMEAIGTLAGGIAHDFNNVLGVILGYAELAQHKTSGNEALGKNLREITIAGKRAKDLVHHILTFGRQEEILRKPIELNFHIRDVLKMVRATLPSTITIQSKFSNEAVSILGDLTQLQQVVLNLCSNAEHAMRDKGGLLEVGMESLEWEKPKSFDHVTLPPGRYIRLWMQDSGHGIPQNMQNRIFDPFFTTKGVGEGTGMGLAVVHGIVTGHHGAISVQSQVGEGTTFEIYFPALELNNESQGQADPPEVLLKKPARVLFIDDEMPLAYFGKEVLEALGCEVDIFTNGLDALECFQKDLNRYDIVISDQTMPGMTGEKLAQQLLDLRSDLPIILCTGFSHAMTAEKAEQIGIQAFLKKPALKEDLI
jgi:PAS domain S-box-containing protein